MPDHARLTEDDELELFGLLTVAQQQAVARGDMDLGALLERLTTDTDADLCPRCAARPAAKNRFGWCDVCHRRELNHALEAVNAAVHAQRDADRIKQDTKRVRQMLGTNPRLKGPAAKTSEDYGGSKMNLSDERLPLPRCVVCGEVFRQHREDEETCPTCVEKAARRAGGQVAR